MALNTAPYASITSQSYQMIQEAFERIGIPGELMEEQKFDAALRSLNFMFQEWMGIGINLWSLQKGFIGLNAGQSDYVLSQYLGGNNIVKNIDQAFIRNSQRQNTGGTSFSSVAAVPGHEASQAFIDIPYSYCELTLPGGQIGYTYYANDGVTLSPKVINMVGIQGNTETNNSYVLNIYGMDIGGDSYLILKIPSQTYGVNAQGLGIIYWFPIPSPSSYVSYYIQEMSQAVLNIQNIYFCTNVRDTLISPISRSNYLGIANKGQQSRPSSYYLDRQADPVLSLWPTPSSQYNCLMLSYEQMPQDISTVIDQMAAPAVYNEAIIWGLAYRLAFKYAPDKIPLTQQMAHQSFNTITENYAETTPVQITTNWSQR